MDPNALLRLILERLAELAVHEKNAQDDTLELSVRAHERLLARELKDELVWNLEDLSTWFRRDGAAPALFDLGETLAGAFQVRV